jgi:leucyl aminopeptidase
MNYLIPVFEGTETSALLIPSAYLENFTGKAKELVFALDENGNKTYVLGLGKKKDASSVIQTVRSFFHNQKSKLKGNLTVKLNSPEVEKYVSEISQGAHLGKYEIGYLKTEEKKEDWYSSDFGFSFEGNYRESDILKGKQLAETQMRIMMWGDAPGNYKTPQILSQWIKEAGAESGFEVEIFDHKACEELGMQALLAVGRGSRENSPVFCILKYTHPDARKTIGLVGKGVTFDTGGVSLKPGDNMNYMKSDMGGAAAVAGTIEMAAKLKLPVNLIGAIPITENCIDSYAIKPGDVIGSYSGKTIEVINTDAEGRLILADALSYVTKNFETDVLIDLATLTGNAIMSLGYKASAMITPNDDVAESLFASGLNTGEKVWRMPHWDDYKDSLKSDIADLKNLAASPIGGAINAAKFLEVFTNDHKAWAHLDVAGTAFGDSEFGSMKSATGYGVRLLLDFIKKEIG